MGHLSGTPGHPSGTVKWDTDWDTLGGTPSGTPQVGHQVGHLRWDSKWDTLGGTPSDDCKPCYRSQVFDISNVIFIYHGPFQTIFKNNNSGGIA